MLQVGKGIHESNGRQKMVSVPMDFVVIAGNRTCVSLEVKPDSYILLIFNNSLNFLILNLGEAFIHPEVLVSETKSACREF